jgi:hypothetical protein
VLLPFRGAGITKENIGSIDLMTREDNHAVSNLDQRDHWCGDRHDDDDDRRG